jgi:hypothetical protein
MQVKGLDPAQVGRIVREVSRDWFAGNVTFQRLPEDYRGSVRFTLRVKDAKGPGHRRGQHFHKATGKRRRMVTACYHAYGEVIRGLIDAGANWVKSAPITLERYRSKGARPLKWDRGTWIDNARDMADLNVGSQMDPVCFSEACDCNEGMIPENPIKYPASPDWTGKR